MSSRSAPHKTPAPPSPTPHKPSLEKISPGEPDELPAWRGSYICYCGTDRSGRSIREQQVRFPQFCLCTDASGRARCKGCRGLLTLGQPRIGVQGRKFHHSGGGTCEWYHPGCFAAEPLAGFRHVAQIEGWEQAPESTRMAMRSLLPPEATTDGAPVGPWPHGDFCLACRDEGEHPIMAARRQQGTPQ